MRTQVHAGEDAFVNTRDAHPTALPPSRTSAWRAGQGRQRARARVTHHQGGDEYAEEDWDGNGNRRRHGGGHGDDE
jgi:hypothetical protein